jgi:hypothetical protein
LPVKRFRFIYIEIPVLVFLLLFLYIRGGAFLSGFKKTTERLLSEAAGARIKVGSVGGNIFKKAVLEDFNCQLQDFDIHFDIARLEYSLWDVITKRKVLDKIDVIELEGGSIQFQGRPVIPGQVDGRVRFDLGRIVLDGLNIELLAGFDSCIKGEIIKHQDNVLLNLAVKIDPILDIDEKKLIQAEVDIEGPIDDFDIKGHIKGPEGKDIFFDGGFVFSQKNIKVISHLNSIDLKNGKTASLLLDADIDKEKASFKADLIPLEGTISVAGDYSKWPLISADITTNHIKLDGSDFSNIIHLACKFIYKKASLSQVIIDINTESTIVNYYPLDEFEISCWVDKDILQFVYIKMGDNFLASGALSFQERPAKAFLKANFNDFDIGRFLFVLSQSSSPAASGKVSGDIFIEGPLDGLVTKANFQAKNGFLGTVDYEDMIINLKGTGPVLNVYDSRLIREDSFLTMEGAVDIREFSNERFMEDLVISTDEKTIIWEGWDITKAPDDPQLQLSRGVNGGLKVGFKKYMPDETTYQPVKPQDEFALEYKPQDKNETLQFKAKEREEFLGVMKKYKF